MILGIRTGYRHLEELEVQVLRLVLREAATWGASKDEIVVAVVQPGSDPEPGAVVQDVLVREVAVDDVAVGDLTPNSPKVSR